MKKTGEADYKIYTDEMLKARWETCITMLAQFGRDEVIEDELYRIILEMEIRKDSPRDPKRELIKRLARDGYLDIIMGNKDTVDESEWVAIRSHAGKATIVRFVD